MRGRVFVGLAWCVLLAFGYTKGRPAFESALLTLFLVNLIIGFCGLGIKLL